MAQTIEITCMSQIMSMIQDVRKNREINRYRSRCVYRGLPNAEYHLVTSLVRNCKGQAAALEPALLRNFTKYAAIEDPTIEESIWRQMILGQHHGLPTRLMDWTHSPMIALHFAVSEGNYDDLDTHDCVVWKIDMEELRELLPDKYRDALRKNSSAVFSVSQLKAMTNDLSQYDAEMGNQAFAIMEPPSIDPRIVNQYSFFSVMPLGMKDIEGFLESHTEKTVKYVIRKELRWQVRDLLDEMNISERIVYPGLDGLTKWLGRHYYVK